MRWEFLSILDSLNQALYLKLVLSFKFKVTRPMEVSKDSFFPTNYLRTLDPTTKSQKSKKHAGATQRLPYVTVNHSGKIKESKLGKMKYLLFHAKILLGQDRRFSSHGTASQNPCLHSV